ncbi:MAG: hypothetical protein E6R04_07240 [Spirochaetes bacterium]|nr:MAG: hypothetical protein E6R04_07240 [Spirochaetota bacterium]
MAIAFKLNPALKDFQHISRTFQALPVLNKPYLVPVKGPYIRQAFADVSMINQHKGLSSLALKNGIDVNKLKTGDLVLFLSAKRDKVKLFGAFNTILYSKAPPGMRVSYEFIRRLPDLLFGQGPIQYQEVLGGFLEKHLEPTKHRSKNVSPFEMADAMKKPGYGKETK